MNCVDIFQKEIQMANKYMKNDICSHKHWTFLLLFMFGKVYVEGRVVRWGHLLLGAEDTIHLRHMAQTFWAGSDLNAPLLRVSFYCRRRTCYFMVPETTLMHGLNVEVPMIQLLTVVQMIKCQKELSIENEILI